jgi:hypothetical protein
LQQSGFGASQGEMIDSSEQRQIAHVFDHAKKSTAFVLAQTGRLSDGATFSGLSRGGFGGARIPARFLGFCELNRINILSCSRRFGLDFPHTFRILRLFGYHVLSCWWRHDFG